SSARAVPFRRQTRPLTGELRGLTGSTLVPINSIRIVACFGPRGQCAGRVGTGNFRAGTDLFDRDVVLVIRADFPDAGAYLGRDEIRTYMRQFLSSWTDAVIEAEDIFGADERVAVVVHQRATGSGSGLSIDLGYWQIWTVAG